MGAAERKRIADALYMLAAGADHSTLLATMRRSVIVYRPELIERILAHRREWGEEGTPMASLGPRAPPQPLLF